MTERKMKDSGIPWIGLIPEEWEVSKIGELYTNRYERVSDKDFPPLSVTMQGILPQLETAAKTDDGDNRKLVRKGDFAINSRSDRRGSCGISPYNGSVSLINLILAPRNEMNANYYNWLFHTSLFADEFYSWGHGIVADLWTTRWQEMKNIAIPIPDIKEQEAIAAWLDGKCGEIDELIEVEQKMIKELEAYRQATITETVTRGLIPDAPMRQTDISWLPEIPEHWELCRLKDIGYLYGGLTGKAGDDFNVDEEKDEFSLFVPFTNIFNNVVINPNQLYKVKTSKGEKQNEVNYGDVLFLMSSEDFEGIGKSSLFDIHPKSPIYLNSFCKGLRINYNMVNSKFLNYLMLSQVGRHYCKISANGFIRINLRQEVLSKCPVIFPPLSEQREIADYLDAKCKEIDDLIGVKREKIETLKQYRQSIIFEAVTGKIQIN